MKTIVITGGTGLLGMRLSFLLQQLGYQVRHLSRKENLAALYPAYSWNINTQEIDSTALIGADAVIHLAGANLADARWSPKVKKMLIDSRVESTKTLAKAINALAVKPSVFIACSAVGYYGSQEDTILTENSPAGQDFMSEICVEWEKSTQN